MRGKVEILNTHHNLIRITPAYAGKSQMLFDFYAVQRDHPRLCGEKCTEDTEANLQKGSPPPMRGKVNGEDAGSVVDRITPAYAGKSGKRPACTLINKDHPRLCGEKKSLTCRIANIKGSPPPMRGKELPKR